MHQECSPLTAFVLLCSAWSVSSPEIRAACTFPSPRLDARATFPVLPSLATSLKFATPSPNPALPVPHCLSPHLYLTSYLIWHILIYHVTSVSSVSTGSTGAETCLFHHAASPAPRIVPCTQQLFNRYLYNRLILLMGIL